MTERETPVLEDPLRHRHKTVPSWVIVAVGVLLPFIHMIFGRL